MATLDEMKRAIANAAGGAVHMAEGGDDVAAMQEELRTHGIARLAEQQAKLAAQKKKWVYTDKPALVKQFGTLKRATFSDPAVQRLRNTPDVVQQRIDKSNEFLDKPTEPWQPPAPERQAFDRTRIKDALGGFPDVEQSRFPRDVPPRANIEHVHEVYTNPVNRGLIKKQIARGLGLGGESFYASLYPVKLAAMEQGISEEQFNKWVHSIAPASARNSIMNEMAVGQAIRDAHARGVPLTPENMVKVREDFKAQHGIGLPMMPVHEQGVAHVLQNNIDLREHSRANIPTNYKIPTYGAQKAGDFAHSWVGDVHEAAGETLGSQHHPYFTKAGGFGNKEYGAAESHMLDIANEMGIPGGTAQAGRWFGGGELTGLRSPRGDALDLLEKQVAYTLHHQGIAPTPKEIREYVLKMISTGQGHLLPWFKKAGMPDMRVINKAEGGKVEPDLDEMRLANTLRKPKKKALDIRSVGVDEAPDMAVKTYVSPGLGKATTLPIGGVDFAPMMPGQQLAPGAGTPGQPQPPQQQGGPGGPGGAPPAGPPGSPPIVPMGGPAPGVAPVGQSAQTPQSNILAMTRQGQALRALSPVLPPPMKKAVGGVVGSRNFQDGGEVTDLPEVRATVKDKNLQRKVPEMEAAAKALQEGVINRKEYDRVVKKHKPVRPYDFVPQPATNEDALRALHDDKKPTWRGAEQWPAGRKVGLRLDIPAYEDHGVWVNSIHDEEGKGTDKRKTSYGPVSSVKNATFDASPNKAVRVATGEQNKSPFARIKGELHHMTEDEAVKHIQEHLHHPDYAQVGMDPRRHGYFYDRKTLKPVTHSAHVVQIGPLVLAHKPTYGKRETYKDGGVAHMAGGSVEHMSAEMREKGKQKFLEPSAVKDVLYHGMPHEMHGNLLEESRHGTMGPGVYLTSSPHAASNFAMGVRPGEPEPKLKGQVMPVHINTPHMFTDEQLQGSPEWRKHISEHIVSKLMFGHTKHEQEAITALHKKLADNTAKVSDLFLYKGGFDDGSLNVHSHGHALSEALDKAGYHGISLKDSGKGFDEHVVFDPRRVKSALGNRGTYNPDEPDMNKKSGGKVTLPASKEQMERELKRASHFKQKV